VCVSRWWTVGTRAYPSRVFGVKSSSHWATGSVTVSRPCSTSASAAADTTVFDSEAKAEQGVRAHRAAGLAIGIAGRALARQRCCRDVGEGLPDCIARGARCPTARRSSLKMIGRKRANRSGAALFFGRTRASGEGEGPRIRIGSVVLEEAPSSGKASAFKGCELIPS
jgi:hypothetical protein